MKESSKINPNLRFPTFKEDWEPVKLNEILKEHKKRNSKGEYEEVFSVAKEKGVINQIEHLGRSYASDDISNYKAVFPNDVVYTKSPTAGFPFGIIKQNKTNRTGVVSVLYAVFKPKNNELGLLLDFYFSSKVNTYNYLVPIVHIGAKNTMNIGNEDFLNGKKIALPININEQKKINSFLCSVEERLTQLRTKSKLLEDYRKSIIQKIFSQELKFKDDSGKLFPQWKEIDVKKILKRYSEPVIVDSGKYYSQIGIRSHGKGIFYKEPVQGMTLGNKRVFWIKEDLLTLNIVFAWERAVAKTSKNEIGMIASHRFPMYKPVGGVLDLDYILYFFLTPRGKYYLELASPGGAGRNKTLGQTEFENLKFKIPSFNEQLKISSFLNSIDKQIEFVTEQIVQSVKFKDGLLQNMFI
ncbi:MAG: restriction endonuclease subunit S [Saprospiraceae bacterium]